jgi:hypothetical protein
MKNLRSVMTLKASARTPLEVRADGIRELHPKRHSAGLADEPSSSLDYLIQFADQERDRLERAKAILVEILQVKQGKPGCAQLPRIRSRTIAQGCGKIMALQVASY